MTMPRSSSTRLEKFSSAVPALLPTLQMHLALGPIQQIRAGAVRRPLAQHAEHSWRSSLSCRADSRSDCRHPRGMDLCRKNRSCVDSSIRRYSEAHNFQAEHHTTCNRSAVRRGTVRRKANTPLERKPALREPPKRQRQPQSSSSESFSFSIVDRRLIPPSHGRSEI